MFTTPEQFAAANKASVDAMLSLANTALASAERIAALNLNTARSMLEAVSYTHLDVYKRQADGRFSTAQQSGDCAPPH